MLKQNGVKNNLLDTIILAIIFLVIMFMGDLSYQEILYGNVCSKFLIIPACYIGLGYLVLLFFFQIFKRFDIFFILLAGFALVHALYGSVGHILGAIKCPNSKIGIPICFIVSAMLVLLLVLKFVQIRVERRT